MTKTLDILNAKVIQEQNEGSFSGTIVSNALTNETVIIEAYERIGVIPDSLSLKQISTALSSLNFILIGWQAKEVKQWMRRPMELHLEVGRSNYKILDPKGRNLVRDIYNANYKLFTQTTAALDQRDEIVLTGTAVSDKGGTPENAFDLNPQTIFTQTSSNGSLQFSYQRYIAQISQIALISAEDRDYTLKIDVYNQTVLLSKRSFKKDVVTYIDIPFLQGISSIVLTETGGSTLSLKQVSFLRQKSFCTLSSFSKDQYLSSSLIQRGNQPTCFYFDKQIYPELNVYPCLQAISVLDMAMLSLDYVSGILDAGSLKNVIEVPSIFYEALVSELAARLCLKEQRLDLLEKLDSLAKQAYFEANSHDQESGSFTFLTDWSRF